MVEPPDSASPQEDNSTGLDLETVRKATRDLPEPYRLILNLVLIEGLDYEEISQYTGIKEGTIRVQYFRARAKLAERLRDIKGI